MNIIERIRAEIEQRNLANYCGTAEQYEEELFALLDTLEEPDNDLEEAAEKYSDKYCRFGPIAFEYEDAFIAGAKWMAEQLKK